MEDASLGGALDALIEGGPEGIARFAETLDPDWIAEALEATGRATIRRRKLPAEQAVWLVLGMGLFADRSIEDVVEHLNLVVPGVRSCSPGAVPQARYRLGAEPMKWLFEKVAKSWASAAEPSFHGLALHAVDGTTMRVQDTEENYEEFGKPGGRGGSSDAGYPQARLACLLNLDSRMLLDAAFGPYNTSEKDLAEELWSSIPDNSLTILDAASAAFWPGPTSRRLSAIVTSWSAFGSRLPSRCSMNCPMEASSSTLYHRRRPNRSAQASSR